jgi:hypothetical protein
VRREKFRLNHADLESNTFGTEVQCLTSRPLSFQYNNVSTVSINSDDKVLIKTLWTHGQNTHRKFSIDELTVVYVYLGSCLFFMCLLYRNITDSSNMQVSLGLEWFCTADMLSHKIHATQNYILMPYQPYAFVMWHFLFASLSWPKITYPSAGYEVGQSLESYTLNVPWFKVFLISLFLVLLFWCQNVLCLRCMEWECEFHHLPALQLPPGNSVICYYRVHSMK